MIPIIVVRTQADADRLLPGSGVVIFSLIEPIDIKDYSIVESLKWIEIDLVDDLCKTEFYSNLIYKCAQVGKAISMRTPLFAAAFPPETLEDTVAIPDQTLFQSISQIAVQLIQRGGDRDESVQTANTIVQKIAEASESFSAAGGNPQIIFTTINQLALPLILRDGRTFDDAVQFAKDTVTQMMDAARAIAAS